MTTDKATGNMAGNIMDNMINNMANNMPNNRADNRADSFAERWQPDREHILLAANAKLPSGTAAKQVYENLTLVLIVERESGRIVAADGSFVTETAREFVSRLLVGYDLHQGSERLAAAIYEVYFGPMKKALVSAIRMCVQQYAELSGR